jgi:dinuclear metal center YbgI/SA1388 family protein
MPLVRDLVAALDALAPFSLAEEWDNVGLLVGRAEVECSRVLCAIDLTPAVLAEAVALECGAIVAYHPMLFRPLKRLSGGTAAERLAIELLERRIAVVSCHTALDAAPGGINDWIADALGSGDRRALVPHASLPASEETKIVTFCPADAVDRLRDALASVGAGRIGRYERCAFETRGQGTFFGGEGTKPTVGRAGSLQRTEEVRLEMVCPRRALALATATIRQFHPYEEPPIEIHPLVARPDRATGGGRRVVLDAPLPIGDIATRLKRHFGVAGVQIALPANAPGKHATIGICAGSGGSHLEAAAEQGCTLFVTGECKHHDALAALERGCGVFVAGHTNTERGYLPVLARRLHAAVPGAEVLVSKADRDPFRPA